MPSLGLDIGGTSVKCAILADRAGGRREDIAATLATARSASYAKPDTDTLRRALREAVAAALRDAGASAAIISHVGLCAPGLFDESKRTITLSVNVPGLVGVPLDELVADALAASARIPTPRVRIVTDAYAATYDAWITTTAARATHPTQGERFLGVALGTGVGACVLDDGVPLLVSGRSPGHLGQIDVSVTESGDAVPIGPDGGRGSLEAYMGVPALIRRFGADFGPGLVGQDLKDPPLAALVRALRICHGIYRPNVIALLGGVGMVLRPRLSDLFAAVGTDLTSVARSGWTLQGPAHAFHAACGAARLAIAE